MRAEGMDVRQPVARRRLQGADRARSSCRREGGGAMSDAAPLVFITGASSGIGQALAARFHRAGYRLALVARRADEVRPGRATQASRRRAAPSTRADVRDVAAIIGAGRACIAAQGVPDVVIANAGISVGIDTAMLRRPRGDARDLRDQQPRHGGDVPAVRRADARARARGTLVGIASVAGIRGLPGHGAYCSSKAAVISYCESLRGELRAVRRPGRDDRAGLHRHAADPRQPLRDAVPDERRRLRRPRLRARSRPARSCASSRGRWASSRG